MNFSSTFIFLYPKQSSLSESSLRNSKKRLNSVIFTFDFGNV